MIRIVTLCSLNSSNVEAKLEELKLVLDSISLINELSAKSEATIVSYGELLSSYIIAHALKSHNIDSIRKDARELIHTNASYTNAESVKHIEHPPH